MQKFKLAAAMLLAAFLLTLGVFAAETVYLDATGATAGAYTTFPNAMNAVDDGGTVIVSGNTTTPTTAYTMPAKAVTITSDNNSTLTLGRVLICSADTDIRNIRIANAAGTNVDFIYANGHNLTIGTGVTTTANTSTGRYISLAAGINTGTLAGSGTLTVQSGTWRNYIAGNYQGTFSGTADLIVDGGTLSGGSVVFGNANTGTNTATVTLTVNGGSLTTIRGGSAPCAAGTVTMHGGSATSSAFDTTIDLAKGASATLESCTGQLTVTVPDDCTLEQSGATYSAVPKQSALAETVYLDATGATVGAYATLPEAMIAVADGGTVIVSGDSTTPTSAYTMPAKAVTITSQNGATLTFGRLVICGADTVFENITLVNGTTANVDFIYANGHDLTIGAGVSALPSASTGRYLSLAAGVNTGTCAGSGTLTVSGGTWRNIYSGNYQGTFTGTADIIINGGSLVGGNLVLGNVSSGTNSATATLTVNGGSLTEIRGGSVPCASASVTMHGGSATSSAFNTTIDLQNPGDSVSLGVCTGTLTVNVPAGCIAKQNGSLYIAATDEPAEAKTVFVDGTGKTEGAYTSLVAALANMPGGGTVVLTGDTAITTATTLPQTDALTITSKYDGKDYTETAALKLSASLTLGADTVFDDVAIERVGQTSGNLYIIGAGHKMTFGKGAICLNYTGLQWITLVGGNLTADFAGDTEITVEAGHFRNVFGGNYNGSFTGDTDVTITGGVYDNAVCGGSFNGNFEGEAHLSFGGTAALLYSSSAPQGVIGGTLGVAGGTAYTFKGDSYLTLCDSAAVTGNIIGGCRNNNITMTGDSHLSVYDRVYVYYSAYGASYNGVQNGNAFVDVYGGDLQGNMFGGGYTSTLSGNTTVNLHSGRLCHYVVSSFSSGSSPAGTRNAYAGADVGGRVGGNATFVMEGGDIYGNLYGGGADGLSTVTGTSTVTVRAGTVYGGIREADVATIDLSAGHTVAVHADSTVSSIIGGGALSLAAGARIDAGHLTGNVALSINGIPLPKTYLQIASDNGTVNYTAQDGETLTHSGGTYGITFAGAQTTVTLTVRFNDGAECVLAVGEPLDRDFTVARFAEVEKIAPIASDSTSATYSVAPGLYTAKVSYIGSTRDYRGKTIYIDGRSAAETYEVLFDSKTGQGFEVNYGLYHTDQVIASQYSTDDIIGYVRPDTPYFNLREGSATYTTNAEIDAFLADKASGCSYMYYFNVAKTKVRNYNFPIVVFTKDEIPAGATLAQIAGIVTSQSGRDILMFNCGVHGNEPSGSEGGLAFISEMCGAYGESVLTGTSIGAIVVIPRLNPEGFYTFTRETPAQILNRNINRDYIQLSDVGSAAMSMAYQLFMPTLTVDAHEAYLDPVWSESQLLTDTYDIGIMNYNSISSGLSATKAVLYGDYALANNNAQQIALDAIDAVNATGLRAYYYRQDHGPVYGQSFAAEMGAFAYVFEVPGICGGENSYARRTYAHVAGFKSLVALTLASDGAIAEEVEAGRRKNALTGQVYDDRMPIVLLHTRNRVDDFAFAWNNPLIGMDGTVREATNRIVQDNYNTPVRYRTRPTAYVFPKDAEHAADVLAVLQKQQITYAEIPAGTALTLQRYSGTTSSATLGGQTAVSFANGAYIVPVDTYRANIVAYLFEPDVTDVTEGTCSFAQAGSLDVSEIYRSTESFIAAKLGIDGTYKMFDVDPDKTVESVTVNGEEGVAYSEDGKLFVATFGEYFTALEIEYTDGTSERIGAVYGDINGDFTVDLADALCCLRAMIERQPYSVVLDVNGDGRIGIADVIRLLKQLAA
ncbi:MAG: hypothetical protein IJU41_05750 [Clostridia bacterium]|nr:hypothetical protein [Clostridia bacterium]